MSKTNNDLEVRIEITIFQNNSGGALRVMESLTMPNKSFLEMCEILARFVELSNRIKAESNV